MAGKRNKNKSRRMKQRRQVSRNSPDIQAKRKPSPLRIFQRVYIPLPFIPEQIEIPNLFRNHESVEESVTSTFRSPDILKDAIRQFYGKQLTIRRLFYPNIEIPIEKYINLSIVPAKDYPVRVEDFQQSSKVKPAEEIYEPNSNLYGQLPIAVPPEQIIPPTDLELVLGIDVGGSSQEVRLQPIVKTLVLGAAGIGKSTLSEYCAHLWANTAIPLNKRYNFAGYEWVFRIPLRNITEERYPNDPMGSQKWQPIDVIEKECLLPAMNNSDNRLTVKEKKELETELHKAFDKQQVLFLLDGIDEVYDQLPEYLCELLKKLLSANAVVAFSRPYNLHGLRDQYGFVENTRLEITGFLPNKMEEYVKIFFQYLDPNQTKVAEQLLTFLNKNPSIAGACRIPINLELLCSAWDKQPPSQAIHSVSGIYHFVMVSLCRRYFEKKGTKTRAYLDTKVIEDCQKPLGFLEYLGCKSARDHQSFIKLDLTWRYIKSVDAQSPNDIQSQEELGFIRPSNPAGKYDASSPYYFNHLTFRDFFAARYLATCLQQVCGSKAPRVAFFNHQWQDPHYSADTIDAFIQQNRFDEAFEFVWLSIAGLLAIEIVEDRQTLQYFIAQLFKPVDQLDFSTALLLVRCLEEVASIIDCLPNELWQYVAHWVEIAIEWGECRNPYNALWSRLRLCPYVFSHEDLQNVFIEKLTHADDVSYLYILNVLAQIQYPLTDTLQEILLVKAFQYREDKGLQKKIANILAILCNQKILPLDAFEAIVKQTGHQELNERKLIMAIETLCVMADFREDTDFRKSVGAYYYDTECSAELQYAATCAFNIFYGNVARFILSQKKYYSFQNTMLVEFEDEEAIMRFLLSIAKSNHYVTALRLEAVKIFLYLGSIMEKFPTGKLDLAKVLIKFTLGDQCPITQRLQAYFLLSKFLAPQAMKVKKDIEVLLKSFSTLIIESELEESQDDLYRFLSVLHPYLTRALPRSNIWVEKEFAILKSQFANIASMTMKKYVALYLLLHDKQLSEDFLLELLNYVIQNQYTNDEQFYFTAFLSDPRSLAFTNTFYLQDCTPLLAKLAVGPAVSLLSLYLVLNKTPSRSILQYCAEHIDSKNVGNLLAALVIRFLEMGKALYLEANGIRYFHQRNYQLLCLTAEQIRQFVQHIDAALSKLTHEKFQRFPFNGQFFENKNTTVLPSSSSYQSDVFLEVGAHQTVSSLKSTKLKRKSTQQQQLPSEIINITDKTNAIHLDTSFKSKDQQRAARIHGHGKMQNKVAQLMSGLKMDREGLQKMFKETPELAIDLLNRVLPKQAASPNERRELGKSLIEHLGVEKLIVDQQGSVTTNRAVQISGLHLTESQPTSISPRDNAQTPINTRSESPSINVSDALINKLDNLLSKENDYRFKLSRPNANRIDIEVIETNENGIAMLSTLKQLQQQFRSDLQKNAISVEIDNAELVKFTLTGDRIMIDRVAVLLEQASKAHSLSSDIDSMTRAGFFCWADKEDKQPDASEIQAETVCGVQ